MDSSSYGGPSSSADGGDGSASPAQPAQAQLPSPTSQSSWYEVQKRRDWSTFGQYLRNHRPPLSLAQCSGADVLEFLRYLDQFGKTKVHTAACPFFGHPSPPAPCPCPLRQAWASLHAIVDRLRAAYEENGGRPGSNPFAARSVRLYLCEVRMHQARARGVSSRPTTSSRFSKEEEGEQELDQDQEEEEEEEAAASPREIPFMTAAAATTAAASSSSPTSFSPSAAASVSAFTSASGSPFRSNDSAGAARSGGGGGGGVDVEVIEKELMFDKVVTPSDVGKLNRLVIPKQHAEKYFPLDAAANEKGLLLSFEDRTGKLWRFRYSYWNSSQSYVLTKGWSRFVKERRLDAGDTVSFCRGAAEATRDRLFIDWNRRADVRFPRLRPMLAGAASPYGPWVVGAGGMKNPRVLPATLYEHHRLRLLQGLDFRNIDAAAPARQPLFIGSAGMPPHAPMPPPPPPPLHITVQPSRVVTGSSYDKKKHKRSQLQKLFSSAAAAAQVASECRDRGGWGDESGGSAAAASTAEAGMWAGGRLQHQVPFDS